MTPSPSNARFILLFDGVCNLCNASINFVIHHDRTAQFAFASLQTPTGKLLAARCGISTQTLTTVVLLIGRRCYTRSSAALETARRLDGLWPLLCLFVVIPGPIRDAVYNWIAENRYRWFGKTAACRIPTEAIRHRFLDETS